MKKSLRLLTLIILQSFFVGFTMTAENIKGIVLDEKGEPIIGTTILEKGTNNGTITDFNGNFTISVASLKSTLVISYIGYVQQEVKASSIQMKIILKENAHALDEVVVVGYGVQKKLSMTGSVSTLSSEKLDKLPVDNISNMIGGRLPGLVARQTSGVPGDNGSSLYIRGLSTTGNSSPLILVDGIERDFQNLDPSEIESINILKDAASAAVYGVRGANGVVLVTTKRGKLSEKVNVTYSGSVSASTNANFPTFLDGPGYAYWYDKALAMDNLAPQFDAQRMNYIQNGGDPLGIFGNTNWFDLIFKPYAPSQNHTLSLTGGTEKTKFFVSASYLNQDGIIDKVSFNRYNLRSNIDVKLNNYIDLKVDVSGRIENRQQPGVSPGSADPSASTDNGGASMGYKNIVFYTIAAKPYINPRDVNGDYIGYMNPLIARDESGFTNRDGNSIQTSASLSVKIPGVKGLKATGIVGYDFSNSLYKQMLLPHDQMTPVYESGLNGTPIERRYGPSPHREGPNMLTDAFSAFSRYSFQAIINYNTKIEKNDINADLIWDQSGSYSRSFGASKQSLPITTIPDLNFGTEVTPNSVYGSHGQTGRAGLVGRVNYAYAEKYLIQLSGRADWSAKFHPDHRMAFFPAASVGWRISEEPFLKNKVTGLENLKLRASWGVLGNDAIGDFLYTQGMVLSSNPAVVMNGNGFSSLTTTAVPNQLVTWEQTTTYNGGMEATFWGGLLSFEADGFYKVTTNILQAQAGQMPSSLGGNYSAIVNSGIVDVRGFELSITHKNKVNKDFNYGVNGNLTFARNRIVKTDDSPNIPAYQKRVGTSISSVMGYQSDGLFQTQEELYYSPKISDDVRLGDIKYKDLNGDGKITSDDRTWIAKNTLPEYMFGLNLDCSYKMFDASLFFQGAAATDIMLSGTYKALGYSDGTFFTQAFKWGSNAPTYLVEGSWTPEHTNAEYPRLTSKSISNNAYPSDFWKRDASYIRLKNFQIGYNLPKTTCNKLKLDHARIYLSGTNLLTLSKLPFIDPESPSVNNGYYPQQRVYSLGVNFTL